MAYSLINEAQGNPYHSPLYTVNNKKYQEEVTKLASRKLLLGMTTERNVEWLAGSGPYASPWRWIREDLMVAEMVKIFSAFIEPES